MECKYCGKQGVSICKTKVVAKKCTLYIKLMEIKNPKPRKKEPVPVDASPLSQWMLAIAKPIQTAEEEPCTSSCSSNS